MAERREILRGQLHGILSTRAQFVWEVGCGHGHFLTAFARAHPEQTLVGIDIDGDRVNRADRKRERAGLTNLHFVRAEARAFLDVLDRDARFSAVYVLFPDPWPKKRHHKHRLMQPEFLREIATRMAPEARLFFRTDHLPYFEHTCELLRTHPDLQVAAADSWPFEHDTVFQNRVPLYYSLVARLRHP